MALDFLAGGIGLPELGEHPELVERVSLADAAHREAEVNQDPIARVGLIVLEEPEVDLAPGAAGSPLGDVAMMCSTAPPGARQAPC